ncbi:MAG TPA: hypothetical protein VNA04_02735, partial [Thermoanaerobaculia bacterium]|nr:hypothetical protein [Thermoanaerobaculia bacterium]
VTERAPRTEVNLAFAVEDNLLRLSTVTIDGRPGRFFLGSAHGRTLLSPAFAGSNASRRYGLRLSDRETLTVEPLLFDLTGVGDAIIGFDAWSPHAVTVNYVSGLVTYQKYGIEPEGMTIFRYQDEPAIGLTVNGHAIYAAVDTAIPDTLVLPRGTAEGGRTRARVEIAGTVFEDIDVVLADVSRARVGNRLLSKFLVSIDYGRQQVGLWRDPRIPLE